MQGKALLVDDNLEFLEITRKFIDKFNNNELTITTANSPIEAINILKNQREEFNVIVSDYQMPELNGLEFLQKIRNDLKIDVPFILMTGHGKEEVAIKAINQGVNYYVQKSSNIELQYKELNHFIMDCLEKSKIQKALDKSINKFNLFFQSATESMYLFNSNLDVIDYNGKAPEFQVYSVKDIIGKNIVELSPSLKKSERLKQYKEVISTGKPLYIPDVKAFINGKYIHVMIHVFKVGDGMGMIASDITNIFDKEMELRRSKATLEYYLESTTENIIIYDQDFNIIHMNKSNQELYFSGKSISNLVGKNLFEIAPFIKETERYQQYKEVLKSGNKLSLENIKVTLGERTYYVNIKAFRIVAGKEKYLGVISTDVTEIKETEQKLLNQNKLIENFINEFSHDARNIIEVIKGNTRLINNQSASVYTSNIIKGLESLSNLLNGSIDLVKAGLILFEENEVNLNEIVQSMAELIIPNNIIFKIDHKLPMITCDPLKVNQIFQNLFLNAVKHAEAKNINVDYDNTQNSILICNDGKSFLFDQKIHLFEKPLKLESGHGIGLLIVKRIIDAHGWKISLETEPKTKFIITLSNF